MENLRVWADRKEQRPVVWNWSKNPEPCKGRDSVSWAWGLGRLTAWGGGRPGRHSGLGGQRWCLAPTTPRGAGPAAGPPGPRWGGQARVSGVQISRGRGPELLFLGCPCLCQLAEVALPLLSGWRGPQHGSGVVSPAVWLQPAGGGLMTL